MLSVTLVVYFTFRLLITVSSGESFDVTAFRNYGSSLTSLLFESPVI